MDFSTGYLYSLFKYQGTRFSKVPKTSLPEERFLKLRSACSIKLFFLLWFQDTKGQICCKISFLETSWFVRYEGNYCTRNRPKKFREFRETRPRSLLRVHCQCRFRKTSRTWPRVINQLLGLNSYYFVFYFWLEETYFDAFFSAVCFWNFFQNRTFHVTRQEWFPAVTSFIILTQRVTMFKFSFK